MWVSTMHNDELDKLHKKLYVQEFIFIILLIITDNRIIERLPIIEFVKKIKVLLVMPPANDTLPLIPVRYIENEKNIMLSNKIQLL